MTAERHHSFPLVMQKPYGMPAVRVEVLALLRSA
jgi:hypothetical protein